MEMILSTQMQDKLRQSLTASPLFENELRRIDGMGELYVSLVKDQHEPYYYKYTLSINDVPHYFFGKS
jgi:hypothetical protein